MTPSRVCPFAAISHSRGPHMCEWFPFTDVVTKHDIVRALEGGTWAELRVRDWDLSGASSLTAPLCTFSSKPTGLARRLCNKTRHSRVGGASRSDQGRCADRPVPSWYECPRYTNPRHIYLSTRARAHPQNHT